MNTLFLNERNCPFSIRLGKILKKPRVLRALDPIEIHAVGKNHSLEELYDVHYTPTLMSAKGEKFEGSDVFLWLKRELERKKIDVDEAMNPHHSEYHSGNKRFLLAVIILSVAVYYSCGRRKG